MKQGNEGHGCLSNWTIGMGLIGALLLSNVALAPPPGGPKPGPRPKPPKPAPRAAGPKRPGPKPRPARPTPRLPKAPRKLHRRAWRYWHPRYVGPRIKPVWQHTGYKYYIGGTGYVVVPQPGASETEVAALSGEPSESDVQIGERLVQLQQLTELIHEWRTLNESPAFHERVRTAEATASDETKATLNSIRHDNRDFDSTVRAAMQQLVKGESAEKHVDDARDALERLMDLADKLPAPSASDSPPTEGRP